MGFLSRHPRFIVTGIIVVWLVAAWYTKQYIETVVQPRQLAARLVLIETQITDAKNLFERGEFDTAQQEFTFIVSAYADDLSALRKAGIHEWIGRCWQSQAQQSRDDTAFASAIAAYDQALSVRSATAHLDLHIETALRKGSALFARAALAGDAGQLADTEQYFDALGRTMGEDPFPAAAAAVHRNIANTHRERYRLQPESFPMDGAMAEYQQALTIAPAIPFPDAHAEVLTDLAQAYILLSERKYRRRHLETAVQHLEKARDLRGIERVPRQHAETQLMIGDTYSLLAGIKLKRRSDRAAHQQRVIKYENRAKKAYRIAQGFGLRPNVGDALEDVITIVDTKKTQE